MSRRNTPTAHSCADPESPETLTVESARARILSSIQPVPTIERVALRDALDRCLAQEIVSPIDVPSHTNSAMDGYALAGEDLPQETAALKLIGTLHAGGTFGERCRPGECVRDESGLFGQGLEKFQTHSLSQLIPFHIMNSKKHN